MTHTPSMSADRTRLVRAVCIGIVVVAACEFLIATTAMTLRKLPDSTDFASYYLAGAQARDGLSPYDAEALARRGHALGFAHDQFPFLYPPPFALAMQPLATLTYPRARAVWVIVVTLALFAALVVNARVLREQARRLALERRVFVWILLAAFVPAALNSTGVHNDIRAGSVASLLYLALVVVAWGLVTRRGAAVALGLASAVILKLTPLVLLGWSAWRGARRATAAGLALLAASAVAAIVRWDASIGLEYVRAALAPAVRQESPLPMNQSLDAMLSRLLVPNDVVVAPFAAPTLKHLLSWGLALALLVATMRTVRRHARHAALLPVELGLVMVAVLIVMKLTWLHTLAAILFVWPCLMLPSLRAAERGAAWATPAGLAASAGFFLSSAHLPVLWSGLRSGPATLGISVHLLGLFVLWIVCRHVLHHERDIVT